MRKYLVFTISFFFLLSSFSYNFVPTANAIGDRIEGELCDTSCIGTDSMCADVECEADLKCNTTDFDDKAGEMVDIVLPSTGICVRPPSKLCVCDPDKSGFTCQGGPKVTCADTAAKCYPAGADYVIPEDETVGAAQAYPNTYLKGVRCDAKGQAECTCNTPNATGSGQNGMKCKIMGDPASPEGTGFCDDPEEACVPGEAMSSDDTVQLDEDHNGLYADKTLLGVHCGLPEAMCSCKNPNRPGTRINSFTCKQVVSGKEIVATDYCYNSFEACIPAPGNAMPPSRASKGVFGDSPLNGIECTAVPKEAVPTPPCAQIGADGQCVQFSTAFGILSTDTGEFLIYLFGVLLSLSGGIALLLIIKAGYQIMVSAGNPEKVKAGREQLVAAIVGLLFIVFSFVILQVITVDILKLPNFN